MTWDPHANQGNESAKCRWEIVRYTRGVGLDLGCGAHKAFQHFIGVDNLVATQQFGVQMKPDVVVKDCTDLSLFAAGSCDFVYSSHLLEHIVDFKAALKEWWRVIKVGGHLVLYLPHKDHYPRIDPDLAALCQSGKVTSNAELEQWRRAAHDKRKGRTDMSVGEFWAGFGNLDHKHDFAPEDIIEAMPSDWTLLEKQVRTDDYEYSFLMVFRKEAPEFGQVEAEHPKVKTAGVVRYGAFGDMLQSVSVAAGLKAQGYRVVFHCSPPAHEVILHDPNIDEIVLQDKDQVPNGELGSFWAYLQKKYDKWVNLSESVEGSLLAMPGRMQHAWGPAVRHRVMNRNYVEFQHEIAGVPHKPNIHFYRTDAEWMWAVNERDRMGCPVDHPLNPQLVMWSLAGSSVHKTWPYMDAIIARMLLEYPTLHVVLVGGPETKILQNGWENEPRVHCKAGEYTMRQTLSLMLYCNMVIGPETGVLNAACMENMPKLIFLSHSTVENLTRDWVNTTAFSAGHVNCPGRGDNAAPACHQMHFGWDHCKRGSETGTAACQEAITADVVWQAIERKLPKQYKPKVEVPADFMQKPRLVDHFMAAK